MIRCINNPEWLRDQNLVSQDFTVIIARKQKNISRQEMWFLPANLEVCPSKDKNDSMQSNFPTPNSMRSYRAQLVVQCSVWYDNGWTAREQFMSSFPNHPILVFSSRLLKRSGCVRSSEGRFGHRKHQLESFFPTHRVLFDRIYRPILNFIGDPSESSDFRARMKYRLIWRCRWLCVSASFVDAK